MARINLDGKFGYLDTSGHRAIANEYATAADVNGCLAMVMSGSGWAYIDPVGKTVWGSDSKF